MPLKRRRFNFPTRIEYGPGAAKDLVEIIKEKGLKKGFLVTDKGIEKVGTPATISNHFKKAGIDITIYSDIKPNPTDENCYEGAKAYKTSKAQFIVGLGGGSPLDAAKVIKCLATHEGPLEKYDDTKGGDKYIQNNMPPYFAIPTTAGTGSEVGRSGLVTIKNKKTIIFSPYLMPDIAVLDPEMTVSLPPKLTASTGIDAFVHSLEAYLVDSFHPYADGLAREGIYRCYRYLPRAFKEGIDLAARGEMLVASAMGATAFQKGLGLNHAIAHALGGMFDLPHGLVNAAIMIPVLKYNYGGRCVAQKLASLGSLLKTKEDADSVIKTLEDWLKSLNMPTNLKEFKIPNDKLQAIEEYVLTEPCTPANPRTPQKGEIVSLLKNIM